MDNPYKILLIEPDLELAKTIIDWLGNPIRLVHAIDNHNVLKQAAIDKWDLVITNIHSSKINDLDITRIVKETDSTSAILIIAENIKVDFILAAMEYHADALLFKPLDKNEFISKVLQLAEQSKRKREERGNRIVLAVGAHPDDVEFGCAGTLAKLRENGNQINILTLSLGAAGGDPNIRKKEAKKAAKIQRAKLFLGDLEDTKITDAAITIKYIKDIVHEINPTDIYTHSIYDNHQDHRAVFHATISACRRVPNIFCYLSPSGTVDFRPNIFINIDRFMDTKLKVIAEFKSQINLRPYLQPDMITATARYWGRFCNYHLAEPMEVLRGYS
ncbi:PIG-L family deacetylase [Legionella fallonii]|uniref:Putative response regulator receiver protein n=1 Tax=Legionella fallonii LLAP-10 TaxID=1212491 RepID=A0A098G255_9GAMM|nr:PIG-L family deacetylase [Legionella fallonii]CEG56049.1 putative response regulator receiver protein [Legionella fallonii LLAP-10]